MRTVIIEHHSLKRDLLRNVCLEDFRQELVGEAANGVQGIEVIRRTRPELVLVGVILSERSGFDVIQTIRQQAVRPRIIVFADRCDPYTVFRAERLHVDGFIDAETNTCDTVRNAICAVANGGTYFSKNFRALNAARHNDPLSFDKILTDRQQKILSLVGDLVRDREISERLEIAAATVEKHRSNIARKLGLRSRPALEVYARDHGFTEAIANARCVFPRVNNDSQHL